MKRILVASSNSETFKIIKDCLKSDERVDSATTIESCLQLCLKTAYEFLFIDLELLTEKKTKNDYKQLLQQFWRTFSDVEIIVLTTQDLIREAVRAVKAGASDYLTYPLDPTEVKFVVDNILENIRLQSELDYLRDQFWRKSPSMMLRTKTSIMKDVLDKVRVVAPTESTVLVLGETGTGKGVIANLIHQHSQRRENQFINVYCGAIPETLIESELFGHEKGAFTGAVRRKLGKFEIANHGTIFLDEIGTITSSTQIKLLQVLQDRTFQRVGGETDITANVRIITATNTDLEKMCKEGTFRIDLFYRLNVFPIEIPPLQKRIEDIALFVEFFLKRLNRFSNKQINDIHPEVLEAFQEYEWPGNIRELENLIERAYILETSSILTPKNFPLILFKNKVPKYIYKIDTSRPLEVVRRQEIEKIERQYLAEQLFKYKGKIKDTAEAAGIGVRQLHKLLTKYRIRKQDFKSPPAYPHK